MRLQVSLYFDFSPRLIEQLIVRKGVTIAGVVEKMGVVEMVENGIDVLRRATPCIEFGTNLVCTMLGTGTIGFGSRAKFVRFQRVFSGTKAVLRSIYGSGSGHWEGVFRK